MTSHPNMRPTHGSRLNVGSRVNVYQSMNRLGGVGSQKIAQLSVDEAEDLKRPMYRKVWNCPQTNDDWLNRRATF